MKKFALIALLALVAAPVFASSGAPTKTADFTVTCIIDNWVSINPTTTSVTVNIGGDSGIQYDSTGKAIATGSFDYSYAANFAASIKATPSIGSGLELDVTSLSATGQVAAGAIIGSGPAWGLVLTGPGMGTGACAWKLTAELGDGVTAAAGVTGTIQLAIVTSL